MDKEIKKMMSPNVKNAYMKLCKASKKELKYIKKRNKILAKKFPDWKDDEFNCDANKFIFGIKRNNEFEEQPSFYTDNIFEVYYNRESHLYFFTLDILPFCPDNVYTKDIIIEYKSKLSAINKEWLNWLGSSRESLKECLRSFKPIEDMDEVDVSMTSARTLHDLYIKFNYLTKGIIFTKFKEETKS